MAAKSLSMTEFKVDLEQLANAIGVVSTQAGVIGDACDGIGSAMGQVWGMWNSPAGITFGELVPPCTQQMHALTELLTEMLKRMKAAYRTYLTIEQTNTRNLQ
jgi:uncharacterized protein YukE